MVSHNGIEPAPQEPAHDPNAVRVLPNMVGDTGFEPVTSSVSRKRAPTAPIARVVANDLPTEVETGFEPVYTALQAVASPLGHSTDVTGRRPHGLGEPSGRRDSNPRPSPWQGDALPTALRPHAAKRSLATDVNFSRAGRRVPNRGCPGAPQPRHRRGPIFARSGCHARLRGQAGART